MDDAQSRLVVTGITELPEGVETLCADAEAQGFSFVTRCVDA